MKRLLTFLFTLAAGAAFAGPTLTTDPYPAGTVQPSGASVSVNGNTPLPCTTVQTPAGAQPTCDLSSLTAPGVYTLIVSVNNLADCTPGTQPDTTTCASGGSTFSAPHVLTFTKAGTRNGLRLTIRP